MARSEARRGRPLKAPHIEGIGFRRYRSASDYPELSRVMNESWKADGVKWNQTPKDLKEHYHRKKGFDPSKSIFIAEAKGKMAGCSYMFWRTAANGSREYSLQSHVVPRWRGTGLREALMGLAEDRARTLAANHTARRKYLDAWASFDDNEWRTLLESRGYRDESHVLNMLNTHLERARELPLPPGIEVRSVLPEHHRKIWNACREALREEPHYSEQAWTESAFREYMKSDDASSPEMWQIAWAGDEVVGGVHNYLDPHDVKAFGKRWCRTERIFVREPWRRKGIASALISRSLVVLREAGMEGAMLMVDVDNPSKALRLYTKMGYETVEHFAFFRKDIGGEQDRRAGGSNF